MCLKKDSPLKKVPKSFKGNSIIGQEMPENRYRIGNFAQHPIFPDQTVEKFFKIVFNLTINNNKFYD